MNASVKMTETNPPWESGLTPATQREDNLFLHRFLPLKTLVFSQYSTPATQRLNLPRKFPVKRKKQKGKKEHDLLNILYNKNYNLKFNFLLTINKPEYISEQDFSLPLLTSPGDSNFKFL